MKNIKYTSKQVESYLKKESYNEKLKKENARLINEIKKIKSESK